MRVLALIQIRYVSYLSDAQICHSAYVIVYILRYLVLLYTKSYIQLLATFPAAFWWPVNCMSWGFKLCNIYFGHVQNFKHYLRLRSFNIVIYRTCNLFQLLCSFLAFILFDLQIMQNWFINYRSYFTYFRFIYTVNIGDYLIVTDYLPFQLFNFSIFSGL